VEIVFIRAPIVILCLQIEVNSFQLVSMVQLAEPISFPMWSILLLMKFKKGYEISLLVKEKFFSYNCKFSTLGNANRASLCEGNTKF